MHHKNNIFSPNTQAWYSLVIIIGRLCIIYKKRKNYDISPTFINIKKNDWMCFFHIFWMITLYRWKSFVFFLNSHVPFLNWIILGNTDYSLKNCCSFIMFDLKNNRIGCWNFIESNSSRACKRMDVGRVSLFVGGGCLVRK